MATNFPGSLDDWSDWSDDPGGDTFNASILNDVQDAVMALQAKVGKGAYSSPLHSLIYNFFATGTAVFLYENLSSLTGWTISGLSDRILAVKGGATYTTGGATAQGSSWSSLGTHTHTMTHNHSILSHNHFLYDYRGGTGAHDFSWRSGSSTGAAVYPGADKLSDWMKSILVHATHINPVGFDIWTTKTGNQTSGNYTGNTAAGTTDPRPTAALGVIATKD
jgi:hypothetical protein